MRIALADWIGMQSFQQQQQRQHQQHQASATAAQPNIWSAILTAATAKSHQRTSTLGSSFMRLDFDRAQPDGLGYVATAPRLRAAGTPGLLDLLLLVGNSIG